MKRGIKKNFKKSRFSFEVKMSFYLGLFILFSLVNSYLLFFSFESSVNVFTGYAGLTTASVGLVVDQYGIINITSPENTTYNFEPSDTINVSLNVTADFAVDSWWFSIYNYGGGWTHDNTSFNPNITIDWNLVQGLNMIYVYANSTLGSVFVANVSFTINMTNTAPIIYINNSIYVCEGEGLNYPFNISDPDIDDLTLNLDSLSSSPFSVYPGFLSGRTFLSLGYGYYPTGSNATALIVSAILGENYISYGQGNVSYPHNITASDGQQSDLVQINITLIEINDELIKTQGVIGVNTIWTSGENSTFYYQVFVNDSEDGDETSSNINFNISFTNVAQDLFNISDSGVMNFTADNTTDVGVYTLTVCVNDSAIPNPYSEIQTYCNQTGGSIAICEDWSLTVTNQNRAPTITNYFPFPNTDTINISGSQSLYFNITKHDSDGTIPDAYWYFDGVQKEYDAGNSVDEFVYSFGCGVSGNHKVMVNITDGELNDSLEWTIDVLEVECIEPSVGSGGPGGPSCSTKWICDTWSVCQNAKISLDVGILSGEDYRLTQFQCEEKGYDERFCGFQTTACNDLAKCNYLGNKPDETQICYFTQNPSCEDGIKNCHNGRCEVLTDCGGPCTPCPTCTDGLQNQEEKGVDCGGPCPWKCEVEQPLIRRTDVIYAFLVIVLILLALLTRKVVKVIKMRMKLQESKSLGLQR